MHLELQANFVDKLAKNFSLQRKIVAYELNNIKHYIGCILQSINRLASNDKDKGECVLIILTLQAIIIIIIIIYVFVFF